MIYAYIVIISSIFCSFNNKHLSLCSHIELSKICIKYILKKLLINEKTSSIHKTMINNNFFYHLVITISLIVITIFLTCA